MAVLKMELPDETFDLIASIYISYFLRHYNDKVKPREKSISTGISYRLGNNTSRVFDS
jgi:hypothetical protein